MARVLDDRFGFLFGALLLLFGNAVVRRADIGPARYRFTDDLGRDRFGFLRPHGEDLRRVGAEPVRFGLRFLHDARRALLGLAADVLGCLPRGAEQPRRLLTEHVQQLLLIERLRCAQLLFEVVEGVEQFLLALSYRRELFGHTAQVRPHLGLGVAAERRTERAVRDFLGEQPRRAADHPLPPLAFSHTNPQEACRRERTC